MTALKLRLSNMNKLRLAEVVMFNIVSCIISYFVTKGQYDEKFRPAVMRITLVIACFSIVYGILEYRGWLRRKSELAWYDTITLMIAPLLFSVLLRAIVNCSIQPLII